jgi:hypothetical protein
MCSSPKTQQAQQPKQNQFANSSLSSSQMASFAAVANAAQARREKREKHEKRKNAHPTSTNVAEFRPQAQQRGGESYFATLLRKWLKKAHLA